jgi:hydrogenase large subunit
MPRVSIDPVTRIEGHLRIDVQVDEGRVRDAWACCTMWRGIERILIGRDPTEAWFFAQRFCGVCTTVHAMASVRAVEDALKLEIPPNAQFIRNLILIHHALHDHIVHFYHLSALDWVDILTIPKADPARAASIAQTLSDWPRNSRQEMKAAQDKVIGVAQSGQLGLFANGYWGHPAMRLSPEVNLLAFSHYLQALEFQRKANQVVAILGSKTPHIQNLTVGGVANAINLDSLATLNMDRLYMIKGLIDEVVPFVQQVYFPDVCAVAGAYADWFSYGSGVKNYLAVPDLPRDNRGSSFDLPGGVLFDGGSSPAAFTTAADPPFRNAVSEDLTHAWYKGSERQHPWQGTTEPEYTDFQEKGKYTWVKAPRYEGKPMQVGPVANILIGYRAGHALTKKWTDLALDRISSAAGRRISVDDLQSTMGRHVARAIRTAMLAELAVSHWTALVNNITRGDAATHNPPQFPSGEIQGVGTHEAPRGTLSHWVVVNKGVLGNYQAVVPTTWNASPRDNGGQVGPYEASLMGNPVANPEAPLEVLRTVHSFDPCMACACHTYDAAGRPIAQVKVQ